MNSSLPKSIALPFALLTFSGCEGKMLQAGEGTLIAWSHSPHSFLLCHGLIGSVQHQRSIFQKGLMRNIISYTWE